MKQPKEGLQRNSEFNSAYQLCWCLLPVNPNAFGFAADVRFRCNSKLQCNFLYTSSEEKPPKWCYLYKGKVVNGSRVSSLDRYLNG